MCNNPFFFNFMSHLVQAYTMFSSYPVQLIHQEERELYQQALYYFVTKLFPKDLVEDLPNGKRLLCYTFGKTIGEWPNKFLSESDSINTFIQYTKQSIYISIYIYINNSLYTVFMCVYVSMQSYNLFTYICSRHSPDCHCKSCSSAKRRGTLVRQYPSTILPFSSQQAPDTHNQGLFSLSIW